MKNITRIWYVFRSYVCQGLKTIKLNTKNLKYYPNEPVLG